MLSQKKIHIPPAIALFLLSPAIGELLSGSLPPKEYFTFFGFTVLTILYGGGAIIAKEIKIRWRKGIGSLLLLGASYGVFEEGLMVASFQNPNWMDIGILGEYGRWLGINWVWVVELTYYHSLVSICIPVFLVELVYPVQSSKPWLHGKWTKILPILFLGDIVFGYFAFPQFTGYYPSLPQYFFLLILAFLFIILAKWFPSDWARNGSKPMKAPWFYGLISFICAFICGGIFWVLPNILKFNYGPVLVILVGVVFLQGFFRYLVGFNWKTALPIHRFYLVFGPLLLFIIFSVFQEFDASRLDNPRGMSLVGLSFLFGLLILRQNLLEKKT